MENEEVTQAIKLLNFIKVGSRVLSARMALILALVLTFILFGWAMVAPDVWRFSSAAVFGILIFLPTIWLDSKSKGD